MKKIGIFLLTILHSFASFYISNAQTSKSPSLEIFPENGNYLYRTGEMAIMNISIESPALKSDVSKIHYRLSRNGIELLREGTISLKKGKGKISATLNQPGFLHCDVKYATDHDTLYTAFGCGFSVDKILPEGELPENFDRFWREAKAELIRTPIDAKIKEVEVVDPGDAKRYKVSLANVNGTRVYGWLHLPEGKGPFPTVMSIPGSGIGRTGRFAGFTEAGIAVFAIEVHGLEPQKHEVIGAAQWMRPRDEELDYFTNLQNGLLSGYHSFGIEDPYRYYHRRTVQSAMRAVEYLCTREDVDPDRIIVFGGSQGGGLSLLTAAIDKRVDAMVATVPAFCNNASRPDSHIPEVRRTMSYYDAALAAKLIEVPSLIGVGFIDGICRPSNVYTAFNNISGPKRIENFYNVGHGSPPDWREKTIEWILDVLK